ncbi:MAG TPA: hypothetical protein VK689_22235 [Armatimonadota bacterium]|nr:hypothetical protein [Armatimonadota bacterium]
MPAHPLTLTEEEARTLLEICLVATVEDTPLTLRVAHKLGDLCRRFLRADRQPAEAAVAPLGADHPHAC